MADYQRQRCDAWAPDEENAFVQVPFWKYQRLFRDSIPAQLFPRYAVPVYALNPSTPLPLQAEYVKSLYGGCVAFLCVSLCFFSLGELAVGCVSFIAVFISVVAAIKARKTYNENSDRAVAEEDKEES